MPVPIRIWQASLLDHPLLLQAQRLYEQTLDADERIPWIWIERSLIETDNGNGWRKHLLLAAIDDQVAGLVYGAFIPGFGGYLCYVTVDERFRGHGIAARLYQAFYTAMRHDAAQAGESLPFVLWESYRPTADDGPEAAQLWAARVKLFERVGGHWLQGLELQTPNYDGSGPPQVPLQVFLAPMDESKDAFDHERLDLIAGELMVRVYGQDPGDPLYDDTFEHVTDIQLVSPRESCLLPWLHGPASQIALPHLPGPLPPMEAVGS